jgi:DNA-binding Xre family transcriptional regulator
MIASYNKLWKLLIDRGMNKTELMEAIKTSPNTIAKMGKNEYISMDVIGRICEYLKCDVGDIMEMIPEDGGNVSEEE